MRIINIGAILISFVFAHGAAAYEWPVTRTATDIYKINDSIGAFRIDPLHIHNGIDLGKTPVGTRMLV